MKGKGREILSEFAKKFIRSTKLYSNEFINYDQKIVCTSTFRLPPEVSWRRLTVEVETLRYKQFFGRNWWIYYCKLSGFATPEKISSLQPVQKKSMLLYKKSFSFWGTSSPRLPTPGTNWGTSVPQTTFTSCPLTWNPGYAPGFPQVVQKQTLGEVVSGISISKTIKIW